MSSTEPSGAPGREHWSLLAIGQELRTHAGWGSQRVSRVLVRTPELRVIVVGMAASTHWPEHRAKGRLTALVLQGRVRYTIDRQALECGTGHMLTLPADTPHEVHALEDALFVLTIVGAESA